MFVNNFVSEPAKYESDKELDEKFKLGVCLDTLTSEYVEKYAGIRCIPIFMEKGKVIIMSSDGYQESKLDIALGSN